jgi:hypothetical protein
MHRLIAFAILLFWAVMFGGLAHVSLNGILNGAPAGAVDFQLLFTETGGLQMMPVLMMIVAALFGWALLALMVSDHDVFREIETYSYAAAIFMMSACAVLAFATLGLITSLPAFLTAALATSIVASRQLMIAGQPEAIPADTSREIARRMAASAAHNSLLSSLGGRPIYNQISSRNNVTHFPVKPGNGDKL